MKETTVVINTKDRGFRWERRSLLKELGAEAVECLGEYLVEIGNDYCITKTDNEKIAAVFYDTRPNADAWTAKVTMTALNPGAVMEIRYWNRIAGILHPAEAKTVQKKANSAGIFEAKLPLEGADLLLIREC